MKGNLEEIVTSLEGNLPKKGNWKETLCSKSESTATLFGVACVQAMLGATLSASSQPVDFITFVSA